MTARSVFIYLLKHPQTSEVRYVGRAFNPHARLNGHVSKARCAPDSPVACWVRSLLDRGLRPILRVVDEAGLDDWQAREQFWIAHHREHGARLLNLTAGGDGLIGASDSTRVKIGAASRGRRHTQEARARMSEWRRGRKKSESYRQKLIARNTGQHHSVETKAKIGAAHFGKVMSDGVRSAISKAHLGRKRDESTRAKHRARRQQQEEQRRSELESARQLGLSLEQLAVAGFSLRAIGRAFGMSHHAVKRRIRV